MRRARRSAIPNHPGAVGPASGQVVVGQVGKLPEERLPRPVAHLLRAAGRAADAAGVRLYAVGGFVRDLLLGAENPDVDLVVEGDGIAFARRLARGLGGRCVAHGAFGTAAVTLPDGFRLDVASARRESYAHPGALPSVAPGSLAQDLARRDFTVNALALCLNGEARGTLLDPFGGRRDLEARRLRVLHARSFVDDPTRILRAARLGARYGFRLARREARLARGALGGGALARVSGARILSELRLAFAGRDVPAVLRRLRALGALRAIHPALEPRPGGWAALQRLREVLARMEAQRLTPRLEPWRAWLLALLADRAPAAAGAALQRLGFASGPASRQRGDLAAFRRLRRALAAGRPLPPSAVARRLRGVSPEVAVLLAALPPGPSVRAAARAYIGRWAHVRPELSGRDLQALGIPPGPIYRRILEALRDARLDGRAHTRDDEVALVRNLVRTED